MKYLAEIAYKGTQYKGWQRQPMALSVQAVVEDVLGKLLGQKIVFIGCGRTDAGVHASTYFGHFHCKIILPENFLFIINKMLPDDIAFYRITEVGPEFHAQFSAVRRGYRYRLHTRVDPFMSEISTFYNKSINLNLLHSMASMIREEGDFRAFCKQPDLYEHTVCKIFSAKWTRKDEARYEFHISANRFLRGMVRLLVGNMLAVNEGRMELAAFSEALQTGERPLYFNEAYPQGLYLSEVFYRKALIPPGFQ
jgi:tRNA pseudouridine38-40 synthase